MKKKIIKGLTCVATLLVLSVFLTACPDPAAGNGPGNEPGNEVVLGSVFLGGSFNGLGAGGGAFKVNHVVESENGGRSARSAVAVERTDALVPLLGSIEDDGKFFELSGFMDPDTRQFFIGGGKDDLVYSITGSMDENDRLEISFIDIRQKDISSGEWDAKELPFTRNDNITAPTRPAPTEAGIPSLFWGKWTDLPTCNTCGAPLPCPQGHLGCPCDNGNYCPQHTVCNDCAPNGMPPCPLHCSSCRNGQYCWDHPCSDCGQNGHPPCPLHCQMCRDGNYCSEHPCSNCGPNGNPPCVAHCNYCKWGGYCPNHNSGGGEGGGTGGDKRSVRTSLLLQNASKSVSARSVTSRSVVSRSVGSIMAASEEDQESLIISQFGISKSRPWMEYLRERAADKYQDFADKGNLDDTNSYPNEWTLALTHWKIGEISHLSTLKDMTMGDIYAEMYGFANRAEYLAAMQKRFNDEAETEIKADDINFLEYWAEGDNHYILGYKKEFEYYDPTWDIAVELIPFFKRGYEMYEADYQHAVDLITGDTGLWQKWQDAGGGEWTHTFTNRAGVEHTVTFNNGYSETGSPNFPHLGWAFYNFLEYFATPVADWPTTELNGNTLKTYWYTCYLNNIAVGLAEPMTAISILSRDPNFRANRLGDNVYVKIALTTDNGVSYREGNGYEWNMFNTEPAPSKPDWWVEGTNYQEGDSGNWPYSPGQMITVPMLVKKPVHLVKNMGIWELGFERKIARW